MACDAYEPHLAAYLYDDIGAEDRARMEVHLAVCGRCRDVLASFAAVREELSRHAVAPGRPPAGVVVLGRRRASVPPWMAFAAGVAAAALLGGGFLAGRIVSSTTTAGSPGIDAAEVRDIAREELSRLPASPTSDAVTREDLDAAFARFEKRIDGKRAADNDYFLDQLANTERRTDGWINEAQRTLRYVALANNPGLSER